MRMTNDECRMSDARMMKMLVAAVLALVAPEWAFAQAPARLRLGTLAPQGSSYHRILQEMGERWRTATSGQVQLVVYAGTMGSEAEIVRRMRVGQLHVGTLTGVGLREIDPAISALQSMPLVFRSLDEFAFISARMQPLLEQRLAERGFVVLFWADAGWVRFFTREPATRPDDFRRLKIFVTAGETEQMDLMRAAGYRPVALEWTDALTAFQTGMIDAIPAPPFFAVALQLPTVARHMLELNWAPLMGATIISKSTWDGLSPERQRALREAAAEMGRRFQEAGRGESDSAVAAMRRRGVTITAVPAAAEAEWRTFIESLYPRIRGSMVPADMFDQVLRLLQEYRSGRR